MSEYMRARRGMGAFAASELVTDGATAQAADGPQNYAYAETDAALRDLQTQINRWAGTYGFTPVTVDGVIGPATVAAARKITLAMPPNRFAGFSTEPDAQYLAMFATEYAVTFKAFSPSLHPLTVLAPHATQAGFPMSLSTLAVLAVGAYFVFGKKKTKR